MDGDTDEDGVEVGIRNGPVSNRASDVVSVLNEIIIGKSQATAEEYCDWAAEHGAEIVKEFTK